MNALDVFAAARPDVEVDEGVLDDLAAEIFDGIPRRSHGSARWRPLAVAAAVVALVAGLAVVVGRPDAPAPVDTVPPAIPDDGEPLRMLPSEVEGTVEGFTTISGLPGTRSLVLSRPQPDGSYRGQIVVTRGPRADMWFDTDNLAPDAAFDVSETTNEGRTWTVVDDPGQRFAQTDLGDGSAIWVSVQGDDAADRAALLDVTAAFRSASDDAAVIEPLPDGLEVVADWRPSTWSTRVVVLPGADGSAISVHTHTSPDPELGFRLIDGGEQLRPVSVRGATGFSSSLNLLRTIVWQEAPGHWVELLAADGHTTIEDLVATAESLRVVSAEEWDRVVKMPDGMAGTPATTAPAIVDDVEPLGMLPADRSSYEYDGQMSLGPFGDANYVALARPDGDGGYVDPVWIARDDRDEIWVPEPEWEGDGEITAFDLEGRAMEFVSDQSGAGRIVQFDVGDGTAVVVTAVGSAGMTRDALGRIALALDVAVPGLTLGTPPDGYEVVASGRFGAAPEPRRTLNIWRDDAQFAGLSVTVTSNPGFPFIDMGDAIQPVTIRGRAGWLTTSTWQADDGPWERSSLRWEEQPGQWVTLEEMSPVALDELTALAESLHVVTAEEWDRAVGPTDETSAAPATTAPPTAPPGRLLVADGSGMEGLGAQEAATLERQGADVLAPVSASGSGGASVAGSRVFVRAGYEELGGWVANEYSVDSVQPIDPMLNLTIDRSLDGADVVLVLGMDAAAAAIGGGDGATAPTVIGDQVTLSAAVPLWERGYLVNAAISRQLRDTIPLIAEIVAAVRPEVLVVQLGTNGPFNPADVDDLRDAVADVPTVVLVTAHADRPWIDTNNAMLAGIDRAGDNLILMDWNAFADECRGECFAQDDLHLTDVGAEYFAEKLSEITGF